MVSNGGMHALSLIFKLMHNSGNKILCQGPIFSGVAELLKSYNYQIAYIPADLNIHELQNFLQMYRNADLIYLNIPNNPTGKIYSSIYLELLLSFSKIHRKTLVLDLVYDEYVFSQFRNFNLLTITKDWDNIFTINSMSKNYGLPGLRVGWIVSHAKNILRLTKLLEDECVCVNPLAQEMAVVAMEEGNQYLIDKVHKGKITVEDTLSHHQQIHIDKLDGGTQYYAKFPVDDIDSFADYMLVQHKMILATSSNYETSDPTSIRIPIGCSGEKIKSCLNILIHGLNIYKNEFHIQT
jgi:aspartate aminotransferase